MYTLPEVLVKDLEPWHLRIWSTNSRSIIGQLQLLTAHTELQLRSCDFLLGDKSTMQMLEHENFDAGITEMIDPCGFGIFSKIGIGHMIATSALGIMDSMGEFYDVPKLPSIVPSSLPYSDRMNFVERTINFIALVFADFISSEFGRRYKVCLLVLQWTMMLL
ncbi:hypothetical protein OSTOST_02527, partial [Ostertagia ostertagi]